MRGFSDLERIEIEEELKKFIGTEVKDIILLDKKYSGKYIQIKFSNNRSFLIHYNDTIKMDLFLAKENKVKINKKIINFYKKKYKSLLQKNKNVEMDKKN